ncbi:response regulator transcription factor [Aminipila butyrica]|uniref:Stage 0 sporulation protein A homolog n=1 Tax=Aminipila butyrica TaxID=433296 RepID=A0A858BRD6_9FIRM|nr:LytTR family DNA-binding domain-containing protein [Aminipila butyrica]QIB68481.1 response regulator transcription factor [Aminipila butyrica]
MIKVMVVEDAVEDLLQYKNTLSKIQGIQVRYASSAEEALVQARDEYFDIFILDIELPGISGLELAARLRKRPEYLLTLILFITGYEKNQLEAFRQFHCYDYILKPFNMNEFYNKIVSLIQTLEVEKQGRTRVRMLLYPMMNSEVLIPIRDIKYAEVVYRTCRLYTEMQEEPFESHTLSLKDLIEEVDEPYFLQCSKSCAVNTQKVQKLEKINYRTWSIVLRTGESVRVSSKYFSLVEEQIKLLFISKKV